MLSTGAKLTSDLQDVNRSKVDVTMRVVESMIQSARSDGLARNVG